MRQSYRGELLHRVKSHLVILIVVTLHDVVESELFALVLISKTLHVGSEVFHRGALSREDGSELDNVI